MFTTRQIGRLWRQGDYGLIVQACLDARPEAVAPWREDLSGPVAAAALALVRFDELACPDHEPAREFLRCVLAAQRPDGGFGSMVLSAVCLRALLAGNGSGPAVERAIDFLARHQRADGLWPAQPNDRLPGDPTVTAFVLLHLGYCPRFTSAVRLEEALDQLHDLPAGHAGQTRRLAQLLRLRHLTPAAVN
jgi:hypothetical protein